MTRRDIEDQVRETRWPTPSPQLRDRILSSVVVAAKPIAWSDRVWFSRACRLAAVAVVLAVAAIEQLPGSSRSLPVAPVTHAIAEAQLMNDAVQQLGLPPAIAASYARREMLNARRSQSAGSSAAALWDELVGEGGGE
jgi:hypothetical protein